MATPVLETEIQPKIPLDPQTNEQDESYSAAVELALSSVLPLTMKAALELDIFNIIAREGPNGKLSASEIAAFIGTKNPDGPDMLDRILRLLASHSILSCSAVGDGDHKSLKRLYSLTPVSKHYVTNEAGVSFGPVLLMLQDKIFTESWSVFYGSGSSPEQMGRILQISPSGRSNFIQRYQMKNAIIEGGIPFEMAHGSHVFKYAGYDQRFNQAFNTGMNNITTMIVKKILEVYKGFENLKKVVDVGGGLGVAISLITATYPHIKGINYDLPHVVKDAPKYPGVEHVGGDMFASIPDADVVFMKGILHDWFDEDCIKLLKNCYKALPVDGKVIVVDAVLPSIPDSSSITKSNHHLDVHLMVQTPGGKQKSAEEFMDLATAAGFSGIKLACFAAHLGVVEFYK